MQPRAFWREFEAFYSKGGIMRLTITIECNNAAFDDYPDMEAVVILTKLEHRMHELFEFREPIALFDSNGNKVGKAVLK